MQKRLAFYMITLGIILAATLVAGLFFFNQLKSPREELVTSLNFRMEAFASDMESLWRNVSVMGVHLSEDMTDLIEERTATTQWFETFEMGRDGRKWFVRLF